MERHAPRGGGKRLESSPQRGGEEAIVSERLASVTSAGEGNLDAKISRGIDVKSVTGKINCHALLSEGEVVSSIQSTPSPEFLNLLPFIKKFYPTPLWGEGKITNVAHVYSCNSHHNEQQPLSIVIPSDSVPQRVSCLVRLVTRLRCKQGIQSINNQIKLQGETMYNLTETVFSRFTSHISLPKIAFTLAEVLITLGIIGVVAALTLPSVINKYRSFVLEQQFKKSYSNLSQTIINMKRDTGIENLRDYYYGYNSSLGRHDTSLLGSFYSDFDSRIAPVDKLKKIYPVTNYSGTGTSATDYGEDWPKATIILKDGSSVGRYVNNGCLRFWIDTNGTYKKPNRYGFDIFEFRVCDSTDALKPLKPYKNNYTDEELEKEKYPDIAGAPCTKNSKQLLNGIGCSWYALNNINPDDNSKKYWDSLPW